MHYYQHHIGDFIKDTSFLTNEEVGIYLKLLWLYYDTEQPLPNSMFELSMKVNARENSDAISGILEMFFTLENNKWHHTRCDKEIAHYRHQLETASKAGKASAAKRALNKDLTVVQQPLVLGSTEVQPTNNQEPITNNQEPNINISPPNGGQPDDAIPDCEHKKVIQLYHELLPMLRKVEVWNDTRAGYLRQRWKEVAIDQSAKTAEDILQWWHKFFVYVSKSRFLTGRLNDKSGRQFVADLEWLVKPSNFAKIIEGKYHGT